MNNTQQDISLPAYSTKILIDMIRNFDTTRENLNADIIANDYPDIRTMQINHQEHKRRSSELEIQFANLEKVLLMHATSDLEQAYLQYKLNKQLKTEIINLEAYPDINTSHSISQKELTSQTKICHNVSFDSESAQPAQMQCTVDKKRSCEETTSIDHKQLKISDDAQSNKNTN